MVDTKLSLRYITRAISREFGKLIPTLVIIGTLEFDMRKFDLTTLSEDEIQFIQKKQKTKQLIFAILFKYYQQNFVFLENFSQISKAEKRKLSKTLGISAKITTVSNRTYDNYLASIREYFKTEKIKRAHYEEIKDWITKILLPKNHLTHDDIEIRTQDYCQEKGLEILSKNVMFRVVRDAFNAYEKNLFQKIRKNISSEQEAMLNGLLIFYKDGMLLLGWVNKIFSNPSLDSLINMITQLKIIKDMKIDFTLFRTVPKKRILDYADRFTRLSPSHLKKKDDDERCAQLVFYCHIRKETLIDQIVDMFIHITRGIIFKSEKRVIKKLIASLTKVHGKDEILYYMAKASLLYPDDAIRKKIYPVVGEEKLKNIVEEHKNKKKYQDILHKQVRGSYARYYRRMVKPFLENIVMKSNNLEHRPIIDGIKLIKKYFHSSKKYFPKEEDIPLSCLAKKWTSRIIEGKNERVKRICYEVYFLKQLGDSIKCREIWIEGSSKHGNPDKDLPADFEMKKEHYFQKLSLPSDPDIFIESLKTKLTKSLEALDKNITHNEKVKIIKRKRNPISVSPLKAQDESTKVVTIKKYLQEKWRVTNLLDVLKEVDFMTHFTRDFISYGEKVYLTPQEISERLLLAIYGFGTNVGLKYVCNGNPYVSYQQLRHIKDYYLSPDNLRNAIAKIANHLMGNRDPKIWGEMPVAVACDSTQFSSYFQNLTSEYHNRYGGRGVMIYWHVEKKSVCLYSQLKNVSSSEVPAMINGILNHCTEMSVEKSYVDTHGQSEIAFAFSHLLNFDLMPRLANLSQQKLSQCAHGDYQKYKNLQAILRDVASWQSIREHYVQMAKYTVAMKDGHADAESILRRFNRNNLKHPTYLALSQLGKIIKTIFLCNYLMHEPVRQEIHEGLNVTESWNAASKFIFYGRSGEISSNYQRSQTLSILSLHLLQLSMVYMNTIMIQQIIREYHFIDELTLEDKRALTPLIYDHISPYGSFPLDLTQRLPHINYKEVFL